MADKAFDVYEQTHKFEESLTEFLERPETLAPLHRKIQDALTELQGQFEYWLKEDSPYNYASAVRQTVDDVLEAILLGDDELLRRYLGCPRGGYAGRDKEHPVIHGKLFETGGIALRKKIVDEHAQVLKDERILDLEDQVASLVKQVNKANEDKDRMWSRLQATEKFKEQA
jgi:hypothetical protein